MVEQKISESDSNEQKTKKAAETRGTDNTTDNTAELPDCASIFDVTNIACPQPKTDGAEFPSLSEDLPKRGRGRPRKDGGAQSAKKSKVKFTPEQTVSIAVANAGIVVGLLDILRAGISGGECPDNSELRAAAVQTWAAYLEEKGMDIPAWVQVTIVSAMYISPALATDKGKGRLSGVWANCKAWWIARRG